MTAKTFNGNLPSISSEGSLSSYLSQIKKFPVLTAKEEYMLAKSWVDRGDLKSAQKLVTSHLRLVAKIAMGYRGYGLPISEMVSEGNIGLMHAVKKFQPEKGFRLATYAMWWIKASIQEYVLKSWSLVKMGTTTAQKKLFFNLKKIKNQISPNNSGELNSEHVEEISKILNVKKEEVVSMNRRLLGKEKSLNDPIKDDNGGGEWQDWLVDDRIGQELKLSQNQEFKLRKKMMDESMNVLNLREKEILTARRLSEDASTLEELSKKYKLSRERIRQIESKAFEKLQKAMLKTAKLDSSISKN
jgi:RNA polymerase sigma-32 factor